MTDVATGSPMVPLSPLDFQVLLVLAREDLYGYAIMQAVEEQSGGRLRPEIGSLYRVLARLMGEGLLDEAPGPDTDETHPGRARKYYRLTAEGREAAAAEAGRLDEVVELARRRRLLPGGGP
jgi:DNA-binding PadR family transcriptional regulator